MAGEVCRLQDEDLRPSWAIPPERHQDRRARACISQCQISTATRSDGTFPHTVAPGHPAVGIAVCWPDEHALTLTLTVFRRLVERLTWEIGRAEIGEPRV